MNHKRVYRLYTEEGLTMRLRTPKRRVSGLPRLIRTPAQAPNERWSMDFVSDSLACGRRFRAFTLVDNFTRECLAIEADSSITGRRVAEVLAKVCQRRRRPSIITCDNGPEFVSRALDQWAYWNGVKLDFIRPGKPIENAHIESFNGRLRQECLNQNWFVSLEDARKQLAAWRRDYNADRPHSSLGNRTPQEFADQMGLPRNLRKRISNL